jgi:hypothetical protein
MLPFVNVSATDNTGVLTALRVIDVLDLELTFIISTVNRYKNCGNVMLLPETRI